MPVFFVFLPAFHTIPLPAPRFWAADANQRQQAKTAHIRAGRRTHDAKSQMPNPLAFTPPSSTRASLGGARLSAAVQQCDATAHTTAGDAARSCIAISGADSASIYQYQRQLRRWPTTERLKFSVEPERFNRR